MQRLEVSDAVRLMYKSLGVRGLNIVFDDAELMQHKYSF